MTIYLVTFETREHADEFLESTEGLADAERIARRVVKVNSGLTIDEMRAFPGVLDVEEEKPVQGSALIQMPLWTGGNWGNARVTRRNLPWRRWLGNGRVEVDFDAVRKGANTDIYIIDTGIRTTHDEFGGRATNVYEYYSSGGAGDNHGHGTAVASLAAGETIGVAPEALLWSFKALNSLGSGTSTSVATSMDQALTHYEGRVGTGRPAVVNVSIKAPLSTALTAVTEDMMAAGMVVCAAAGNDANSLTSEAVYPAETPGVLCVGGTNALDGPYYRGGFGTNYGSRVDVVAPAQLVWKADFSGDSNYNSGSGTSYAAPITAGVIACMLDGHARLISSDEVAAVVDKVKANATAGAFREGPGIPSGELPDKLVYLDPVISFESFEPVTEPGTELPTEPGTELPTEPGTEPGTELPTEPGTEGAPLFAVVDTYAVNVTEVGSFAGLTQTGINLGPEHANRKIVIAMTFGKNSLSATDITGCLVNGIAADELVKANVGSATSDAVIFSIDLPTGTTATIEFTASGGNTVTFGYAVGVYSICGPSTVQEQVLAWNTNTDAFWQARQYASDDFKSVAIGCMVSRATAVVQGDGFDNDFEGFAPNHDTIPCNAYMFVGHQLSDGPDLFGPYFSTGWGTPAGAFVVFRLGASEPVAEPWQLGDTQYVAGTPDSGSSGNFRCMKYRAPDAMTLTHVRVGIGGSFGNVKVGVWEGGTAAADGLGLALATKEGGVEIATNVWELELDTPIALTKGQMIWIGYKTSSTHDRYYNVGPMPRGFIGRNFTSSYANAAPDSPSTTLQKFRYPVWGLCGGGSSTSQVASPSSVSDTQTPGGGNLITLSLPSGTQEGDELLLISAGLGFAGDDGWTLVENENTNLVNWVAAVHRTVTATDITNGNVTAHMSGSAEVDVTLMRVTGFGSIGATAGDSEALESPSTDYVCPSVTAVTNSLVVCATGRTDTTFSSTPSGMTVVQNGRLGVASLAIGNSPGATGAKTFVGSSESWAAITMELRP